MANVYNRYVAKAALNLIAQMSNTPFSCTLEQFDKSAWFEFVAVEELIILSKKLKNKMSSCDDGIRMPSPSLIKSNITSFVKPLAYIINNSLKYSIFPETLKTAIIIPIYKKGDPKNMSNYRPISIIIISCHHLQKFLNWWYIPE